MVWPKNIFIQTVVRQMDLRTYIGSVTLKEGRAIECAMLLFSSTTLGTCTRYGYVVKKSKGKYIVGTGLEGGGVLAGWCNSWATLRKLAANKANREQRNI